MQETYYDLLGLEIGASNDEIRQAYFRLARQYHPDTNPGKAATELFIQVQNAYEVLIVPEKRRDYDISIENVESGTSLLDVSILLSTQELMCTKEAQLLYALIEIKPQLDGGIPPTPPVHFCFVVDVSSSMKGSRIELVRQSLRGCIEHLAPDDLISIVSFNDFAEIVLTPTKVSDPGSINRRINDLETSGGTEIYKGLKAGVDLLWQGRLQNHSRQLILLTDGHTYGDEEKSYKLAKSASEQGITVHTIGFGHEWNDIFLDKLAVMTGGNSIFAYHPKDLSRRVKKIYDSCKNLFAKQLTLDYVKDKRVGLEYIFRVKPEVGELEQTSPIILGDLLINESLCLFMAFKLDSLFLAEENVNLLSGSIMCEAFFPFVRKLNQRVRIKSIVKNYPKEIKPPAAILKYLSMVRLYQMQEKARAEANDGNIIKAVEQLGILEKEVRATGDQALADLVKQEANTLVNKNSYSADGDKRIKYGTRTLLKLPAPEEKVI